MDMLMIHNYTFRPESSDCHDEAVKRVEVCITGVRACLVSQKLRFNNFKTEYLIIGTYQQLRKIEI